MNKQTSAVSVVFVLTTLFVQVACAGALTTQGSISKVTVYRGQALVTRIIGVDLPQGTSELIVQDLPAKIVPDSLYAQSPGNVAILSVRYRERAVREDIREEVKQLDAQIEEVKNKQHQAKRRYEYSNWMWHKYEALWKFVVDANNADMNRAVLQSKQIEQLTKYLETKAVETHKTNVEMEVLRPRLDKQLQLLERKREELAAGSSPTKREAILFINKTDKKKTSIELSYLVNGANWLPQYNLRANPDESLVLIQYNAIINQTSGEGWNNVALSVSTAEPTMVAAPPVIEPMIVTLASPARQQTRQQQAARPGSGGDFQSLIKSRRRASRKGKAAQSELSQIALDNQILELNIFARDLAGMKQQVQEVARIEGVSVTYDLPGKLSLPSRSDQQLVTIASITCPADFVLLATPLLTDYVYLQGQLLNGSDTVLLPGPASMFRNGEFVGTGRLPLVTIAEKFTAGFGIDSQVQVTRELVKKTTRIQGGNRIDTYNYRVVLSNYKTTAVKLLKLLDRLAHSDSSSIKIDLLKTNPELSQDEQYLRTGRKKGILRWDLQLEPNTVGKNALVVDYSFTMEYDRKMQIKSRALRQSRELQQ